MIDARRASVKNHKCKPVRLCGSLSRQPSEVERSCGVTSQSPRVRRWRRRFRPTTPVAPAISAFLRSGVSVIAGNDSNQSSSRQWLDPPSSCHKWRPYLLSPYMQSSDGAIEELNWVPALCHRRQQSTEQAHVTMVFCSGMTKCLLYGWNKPILHRTVAARILPRE